MAGMEGGVGGPPFDWRGWFKFMFWLLVACVVLCVIAVKLGYAASFYPACLKPDGDWVHGVTKRECSQLHGRWYTASVLKKARKVW